jgi:hypothetical protein
MRKIEDYRKHAEECRLMLARSRTEEERQMLLNMAATWESLAKDREDQMARQERLKELDALKLDGDQG